MSGPGPSPLERGVIEGENPVSDCFGSGIDTRWGLSESGCLGMQPQVGGKFHPRLNKGERPIANKYREGKVKRTLKRELKAFETDNIQGIETMYQTIT